MDNKQIEKVRWAITGSIFLRYLVMAETVWCFVWGAAMLGLRISIGMPASILLTGLAVFGGIALGSFALAYHRRPKPATVKALLDSHNRCGGLLMAENETKLDDWLERLPPLRLPVVRWRNRRKFVLFASALLFLALSVIIPERKAQASLSHNLETGTIVQEMKAKVDLLEEIEILNNAKAKDLEERLDNIDGDADARDPIETWEALDSLNREIQRTTDESLEKMAAGSEDLALSADLSELLDKVLDENGEQESESIDQLMQELSRLAEGDPLKDLAQMLGQNPDFLEAAANGDLSAEQMRELSEMLKNCEGDMLESLQKLADAQMIDADQLASCASCTNAAAADLAKMVAECSGGETNTNLAAAAAQMGLPAEGGISRGRGDAPMTWSDPSSEQDAGFKEETLTPAGLANIEKSRKVGESIAAPEESDGTAPNVSGVLSTESAAGGSAHKNIVFPEHKGTVKRYFERSDP